MPASDDESVLIPVELLPEVPEVPALPDVLDPIEPEPELPDPELAESELLEPRLPELPLLVLGELDDDPLVAELSVGDPVVALPEDGVPVVALPEEGVPVVALPEDGVPVVDPLTLPDAPLRVSSVGELGLVDVELPVPVPVPELGVLADELDPELPMLPELPVLPELPELPPPVCATAPAAVSAAAAKIEVAHFPMLIKKPPLNTDGGHARLACEPGEIHGHMQRRIDQSRARSYCAGQCTCTPSCRAAERGQ